MILDEELEKRGFPPAYCGANCPDGWKDLVLNLLDELEGKCKIAQIKEKFGLLTVYVDLLSSEDKLQEVNEAIHKAEEASSKICEVCGAPGKRDSDGWITVLCEPHRQERIEKRKSYGKR